MKTAASYTISPKRKREIRRLHRQHAHTLLKSTALSRHAGLAAALAVTLAPSAAMAVADPSSLTTVSGDVSHQLTAPGHLQTTQTSNRAIITGPNVDVLEGESWRIQQPSSSSALLVRVNGGNPTQILGELTANGQLMLVNGSGVMFGKNAQVNVAGLVASSADISNENFNANQLTFDRPGRADASIVNHGSITAQDGGLVALLAPGVQNDGVIVADMGTVALGAGESFTVDFYGDNLYSFTVDKQAEAKAKDKDGNELDAAVANSGSVKAGRVLMTARAAKEVVDHAINTSGIVEATAMHMEGGDIVLDGGEGSVTVAGTLDASGKNATAKGGSVTVTSTKDIRLAAASKVDVSGAAGGGKARIGGDKKGQGSLARTKTATVENGAVIDASAQSGNAGDVVVWSDSATDFNGHINISSQQAAGGFAEVSSKDVLTYNGFTNAVGATDYGTLLLDPGNWTISSSATTGNNQNISALVTQLNSANVTIDTSSAAFQPGALGDINVVGNVIWTGPGSLTLNAQNDVTLNGTLANTLAGGHSQGAVTINAGNTVSFNSHSILTNGGDINLNGTHVFVSHGFINSVTGDIAINNTPGRFSSNDANIINTGGNVTVQQNISGSIQNAIDALGIIGGSTTLLLGNGGFVENVVVDQTMTIKSVAGAANTRIWGRENKGQSGSLVIADGVKNVVIDGINIIGKNNGNPALDNAGLHLMGNNEGAVIQNSVFSSTGPTDGIRIDNTDGVVMTGNTFLNVVNGAGIRVVDSDGSSITGSQFNTNLFGVVLDNSENTSLSGLTFLNNDTHFLGLGGSLGTQLGSSSFTGGQRAIVVNGADTDFAFSDEDSSFSNIGQWYFALENGAMNDQVLDASFQSYDGVEALSFNLAQYNAARGKTLDEAINPAVGFVYYGPVPLAVNQDLLDQLLERDTDPLRNIFSYSGKTLESSYVVSPYNFSVEAVNLSLLAPTTGQQPVAPVSPVPMGGPFLGNLSPAAGKNTDAPAGTALAALAPAAGGGAETCVNSILADSLSGGGNCGLAQ